MLLDCPNENNILMVPVLHPFQDVRSETESKGRASASGDEQNLVEFHGVGEGSVRSIDGRLQLAPGVLSSVLVEVTSEAIMSLDSELHRIGPVDSEGVGLKLPDFGNPDKAMLSGLCQRWYLLHDNLRTSIGQRVQRSLVIGAVEHQPSSPDESV